uniref:Uncharacterized protein n=1 Tax=Kalanchoe fedtschenkoi TaxID=63787 RepID=A0A7N0VGA2_KALFE
MNTEEAAPAPKKAAIPPYMKAISGSLGGIVEASCLQPIDVIKTRLQLDRSGAYKGIVHCGTTVARTEGVRALWKGLTPFATHLTLKYALRMGSNAEGLRALWKGLVPRLMRIPPGQAIMWAVADQVMGAYERRYMTT